MKTALITGAGSGIGRATAQHLYAHGWNLMLLGRRLQALEETASGMDSGRFFLLQADVCALDQMQKAASLCGNSALNLIVANAGLGGENHFGPEDRWPSIIQTNLSGTYHTIRAFQHLLQTGSYSNIVIVSSVLARLGVANYTAYCASKAGLLGLSRSLAIEMAPQKILVNAICPGWVDTQMAQDGLQGIADGLNISKAEFFEIAMKDVPLGKMSQANEIAALIHYLATQQSITGQTIDINNGSIMA